MKALLWISLFVIGLSGVVVPIIYLYYASSLPQLESEFDLEKEMRLTVEGERMSLKLGLYTEDKGGVAYEKPDFSKIPKDFVALYIAELGCPSFFQTPREEGLKWSWRIFDGAVFHGQPPGDGHCEHYLAMRIAEEIGIPPGIQRSIAASKIHAFLQKDQLIAYELSGTVFDRAVVGLDAASQVLYGKTPDQLTLPDLAELSMGLPLNGYFEELKTCKNPSVLRQSRDYVLTVLMSQSLVTEDRGKNAQAQPLACTRTP